MATKSISDLTDASALIGTEVVPIVQSGITVKTTIQNIANTAKGLVTSVSGRIGAVTLTKSDVGLTNVDNTSDVNKPISTATQTALSGKVSTVNGKSGTAITLVKADIGLTNVDDTSDANKPISTATQTALNAKLSTSGGTLSGKLTVSSGGAEITGTTAVTGTTTITGTTTVAGPTTITSTLKVTGNISGNATPVETMTSGFVHIPYLPSQSTGPIILPTPDSISGYAPMYLTKSASGFQLCIYDGISWKRVTLA